MLIDYINSLTTKNLEKLSTDIEDYSKNYEKNL